MCSFQSFCLLMKPHDAIVVDCHIAFIAKKRMHRNVWLTEGSRAPVFWWTTMYDLLRALVHLHCDFIVMLPTLQGRLARFTKGNHCFYVGKPQDWIDLADAIQIFSYFPVLAELNFLKISNTQSIHARWQMLAAVCRRWKHYLHDYLDIHSEWRYSEALYQVGQRILS